MKFLGSKPARLGMVASLYDQYTTSALTEALMNIYTQEKNPKNSFQKLNTFMVEWDIKVERVKKVMILSAEGDGHGGSDVLIHTPENYYQKYDTFIVEETRQQFIVMNRPQRLRDNDFLLVCKILDDNYDVAVVGDLAGKLTRFVTNYMPEMHECSCTCTERYSTKFS